MTKIIDVSGKGAAISATENDANLDSLSGINAPITATTHTIDVDDQNDTIEYSHGTGIAVTLPAISTVSGGNIHTSDFKVTLKNIGAGDVVVTRGGTDTFENGATSLTLGQYDSVTIQTDSTLAKWNIISRDIDTATKTGTEELTNKTLTSPVINTGVSGTAKIARLDQSSNTATTSGTTVDIGSIPSWAKKLTVTLAGVSTNGTSDLLLQIGDSGGIETSSYVSAVCIVATSTLTSATSTAGFILNNSFSGASAVVSGTITLTLHDASNKWVASGVMLEESGALNPSAGYKSLSGTLTQVRLTSVSADTFDAGSIRVTWEG